MDGLLCQQQIQILVLCIVEGQDDGHESIKFRTAMLLDFDLELFILDGLETERRFEGGAGFD